MQRLVLTFLVLFIPQVSPAQVPVDAFASLPREVMPVLSPEGQKIASVVSLYGQQVVLVRSIGGKEKPKLIYRTDNKKSRIQWLEWANSERLLIALRAPSKRFGLDTTETRLASIVYDGTGLVNMVPLKSNERIPQFQDDVIDLLPADSDHVLMSLALSSTRGKLMDGVYKVNVNTGKRKRVQSPTADILQWQTDRFHRVRLNVKLKRGITTISVRDPNEKKFKVLWRFPTGSPEQLKPIGFGRDPNALYVLAYHNDYKAVFRVDLASADLRRELVFALPDADVQGQLWYSSVAGEVVGVRDQVSDQYYIWHEDYLAFSKGLSKALPDTDNTLMSFSADERRYVVLASSDTRPGDLLYGDRDLGTLTTFGQLYPKLNDVGLVEKQAITYEARDGVSIPGYISVPRQATGKLPTIILPHGGPATKVTKSFSYWTQFFVNRGYAVVEMNFRGSDGLGYSHLQAGTGSWADQIHNDITDGARWAIDSGIADPERVCIVGGSFGGYAALLGVALEPNLYACAVAFAPLSDLLSLKRKSRLYMNSELVEAHIGSDTKALKRSSPRRMADRVQAPVLIIHGEKDRVVDVKHGRDMHKALRRADKVVTYVELEDGDHYLSIEENRLQAFRLMEDFLARHLSRKPLPAS